jgi:hypothetical protein
LLQAAWMGTLPDTKKRMSPDMETGICRMEESRPKAYHVAVVNSRWNAAA